MLKITDKIKTIKGFGHGKGCSNKQLEEAQAALGMAFPPEYIEYVREFGCIDFGATEWTGLNIKGYLNTVTATEDEKNVNPAFPAKHFVLDDFHIDAKKAIVNESGEVFVLQHERVTPLCKSISEYLDMCIERNV